MAYLRPFATQGEVVKDEDIARFFEERREKERAARIGAGR
jgi:hypothetical protein